ncbi:hypothetical protein Tco_0634588 [Tanacetum coccineum]
MVFVGNFTYVVDFMIVEDISSIIDPRLSQVVLRRPFIEISNMTHDPPEGVVRFINGTDEVAYEMPHKIEQYDSLSDLEKEHTKSVYLRNEEDKRRGVEYNVDLSGVASCDGCARYVLENQFLSASLLIYIRKRDCVERIPSAKGGSSSIFTFFNLPAGAELVLEIEELLLPLAGAEEGLFIVISIKVSALNVDFDFKIDLIVFGPETGSAPVSFSSGGRRCNRLKIHQLNHNELLKSQRQQLSG